MTAALGASASWAKDGELVDPGELVAGRYGFIVYADLEDAASGWFELLGDNRVTVSLDHPVSGELSGTFAIQYGEVCFSGFADAPFPEGCGRLALHRAFFADETVLWFASAEPGAFYPGDNLELLAKRGWGLENE